MDHVVDEVEPGACEVQQHRERRSDVKSHRERQTEALRIEPQGLTEQQQMCGGAHRQEFREPLNEAEKGRRREIVHLMPARAARIASCASRSWPRAISSCFAHDLRWPGSRKRIATD